jgi:hypothetical protein
MGVYVYIFYIFYYIDYKLYHHLSFMHFYRSGEAFLLSFLPFRSSFKSSWCVAVWCHVVSLGHAHEHAEAI